MRHQSARGLALDGLDVAVAREEQRRAAAEAKSQKLDAWWRKGEARTNWPGVARQLARAVARALGTSPDTVSVLLGDPQDPKHSMTATILVEGVEVLFRVQPAESKFSGFTSFWLTYEPTSQTPIAASLSRTPCDWPFHTLTSWHIYSFKPTVFREVVNHALTCYAAAHSCRAVLAEISQLLS